MKQVYDNLFVGDVNDADNPKRQAENDITYILNVSGSGPDRDSAPGYEIVKEKNYIHIPLADDGSNPDFLTQTAIKTARRLHEQASEEDEALLVHCAMGSSRSVSIAASLMSLRNGKRVRENVNRVKKVHPVANPQPDLLDQVSRITSEIYNG